MRKKITIYSSKSMKDLCDRMGKIADRIEAKENQSMVRAMWNIASKKPIIGKESITKKVIRKLKKNG